MKFGLKPLAPVVAAALLSGCVFYNVERTTKGDIALQWEFHGTTSCAISGVVDVLVSIRGQDSSEDFEVLLPCAEAGGTFTDFVEGDYTVHLEGLEYYGAVLYSATVNTYVDGGATTDLGWVQLHPTTTPPLPTGSLSVDWAFLYPQDQPTLSCGFAGVEYVGVRITDTYGALLLDQSIQCLDGPATFDLFDPGDYYVELFGYGSYRGNSITLFQSNPVAFSIYSNQLTTVGIIDLAQIGGQFGDISIGWSFGGNNSCSAVGVDSVTLYIKRIAAPPYNEEEVITASCVSEPQLLYTFVPGDYAVEVEANGPGIDYWYGAVDVALPPGTLADITIQTELH